MWVGRCSRLSHRSGPGPGDQAANCQSCCFAGGSRDIPGYLDNGARLAVRLSVRTGSGCHVPADAVHLPTHLPRLGF